MISRTFSLPLVANRTFAAAARAGLGTLLALSVQSAAAATLSLRIDGIDGEMKAAAAAATGIPSYADRRISAAQAQRLYARAPARIARSLERYGYFNTHTDGELRRTPEGWTAELHVHPGPPTVVTEFDLTLPGPALRDKAVGKAVTAFVPKKGQRLDQAAYEKSKAAVQTALLAEGYLDAEPVTHRVEVRRAENRAAIHLRWNTGVRYRYGATTFHGGQFFPGFLDRYLPWQQGDYYAQTQLLQLQQRLVDADYFAIVEVQPDLDHAHDGVVPITVTLGPAERNVYTAGVFVDTDIGVGVSAGLTRRWLNRSGHKLRLDTQLAQRLKSAAVTYTIPLPGRDDRSYNVGISYLDQNTDTTQSKTMSLAANETRRWHGISRTLGLRMLTGDFTILDPNGNHDLDAHGNTTLIYPELVLEHKHADNPLFVRRGYSLRLTASAGPGLLSSTRFAQLRADARWIHALGRRQRVILRASLGATAVSDFDRLPPQLRFFAGGDRSIRGYPYQVIGPHNATGLVVGGRDLALYGAEYEYYFAHDWGMATFVDGGDAFSGLRDFHNHIGAGIGLRWRSPVGMVRLDLGTPVDDPHGRHGIQLHLVLGPDL